MTRRLAMACKYAHKGFTNMELEDNDGYSLVFVNFRRVHPVLGECFIGSFVEGMGAFDVHFPVGAVRVCTPEEIAKITRGVFEATFAPGAWKAEAEDFITDLADIKFDPAHCQHESVNLDQTSSVQVTSCIKCGKVRP